MNASSSKPLNREDLVDNIDLLLTQVHSAQLATLNPQNQAESSYTPYLVHQGKIYIFISELASHTHHIQHNPRLSLMIIEDESRAKNIFARKRVILNCHAEAIDRADTKWGEILALFEQRHGNTVALLKSLPDFILFELDCLNGSYIQGFGQAFKFDKLDYPHCKQVTGK